MSGGFAALLDGAENARDVRSRCANGPGDVRSRRADAADDRSDELLARRHFDTAVTPARSRPFSPMAPPRISKLVVLLGESPRRPWPQPRGLRRRRERSCPSDTRQCLRRACPSRAILASLFLATRTDPPSLHRIAGAQVLHLCNRETFVVGNHHDARAFEDLAEFLDHFLFLGSIHSFTPSMGGLRPPGSMFADAEAGVQVRITGLRQSARGHSLGQSCRIPSRAGIMSPGICPGLAALTRPGSPTVLDETQNSARRIAR